ncbi:murein L,D-transpeptidase family protein [Massilia sp. CF038]|uniref:L,D-transpeptidase family protein n=1 Tax=Massilia sp. CF038 TaxID=1881045 RepID=UPI000919869C|nr:L,D-transpeptidase family protein [Massilia sp. CF038]SHH69929.1 L,D-transpeptidase catalytic domain [Massilia sp. CF038]
MKKTTALLLALATAALVAGVTIRLNQPASNAVKFVQGKARGGYTIAERLNEFGPLVQSRMQPHFRAAGVAYPPQDLAYLAFKDQRVLQVYARNQGDAAWRFVKQYPVLRASGMPGPKLMEGDKQVPEGVYRAESLNPNSRFHLSIRLDYPNAFDRRMAQQDQRSRLGGDIMIHGSDVSIGCLAMGDEAAEDLFIMGALATKERVRIVVSPTDFRVPHALAPKLSSAWAGALYTSLRDELRQFPAAPAAH